MLIETRCSATEVCRMTLENFYPAQDKLAGSMSTVSVTSSGNCNALVIIASAWLNRLIAFVRSIIW